MAASRQALPGKPGLVSRAITLRKRAVRLGRPGITQRKQAAILDSRVSIRKGVTFLANRATIPKAVAFLVSRAIIRKAVAFLVSRAIIRKAVTFLANRVIIRKAAILASLAIIPSPGRAHPMARNTARMAAAILVQATWQGKSRRPWPRCSSSCRRP